MGNKEVIKHINDAIEFAKFPPDYGVPSLEKALTLLKSEPEPGEFTKALSKTLEIYAATDKPVSQEFYQGLCLKAEEEIDRLTSELAEKKRKWKDYFAWERENEDVKFEIAILLEKNYKKLKADMEAKHGKCPSSLNYALRYAFDKAYSPPKFWDTEMSKFRVIENVVYYVRDWHLQVTFIRNFSMNKIRRNLGEKGRAALKEWYKQKNGE